MTTDEHVAIAIQFVSATDGIDCSIFSVRHILKVDMPILTCIFFTNNWLTLTSEMHFVKFHPQVASCLLSRGKRKYAPLGMRLLWKYIRNYFLVYQLTSHFSVISPKLQRVWSWNFGFATRKIQTFIWYQKMYYFRLSLFKDCVAIALIVLNCGSIFALIKVCWLFYCVVY